MRQPSGSKRLEVPRQKSFLLGKSTWSRQKFFLAKSTRSREKFSLAKSKRSREKFSLAKKTEETEKAEKTGYVGVGLLDNKAAG